jgi:hypothetical protein
MGTGFSEQVQQQQPQATPVIGNFIPEPGSIPMQRTCSSCQQYIVTRVESKNGLLPWVICGICTLFGCWLGCCLIPFCIDDLKV